MKRLRWIAVAAALGAGLLGAGWVLRPESSGRGLEFAPDMVRTPAVKSFAASGVLPGGTSMQPLVEGVVIRGSQPFDYGWGPEEAKRAGAELENPFKAADAKALARGERVFGIFCATCHGADGETKPPAVLRGATAPPSLLAARAMGMKDGEVFHVVTKGQGKMPSYAGLIAAEDRWKAILHLRKLQQGGTASR